MKDGFIVEAMVGDAPVPSIQYTRSFAAWRVYTSPKQLNAELIILVLEMAVVWGLLGLLLARAGVTDNALAPLFRSEKALAINNSQLEEGH